MFNRYFVIVDIMYVRLFLKGIKEKLLDLELDGREKGIYIFIWRVEIFKMIFILSVYS